MSEGLRALIEKWRAEVERGRQYAKSISIEDDLAGKLEATAEWQTRKACLQELENLLTQETA